MITFVMFYQMSVFECARWQSHRFELMSIIGTITAANIVEVMLRVGKIGPHYVKQILRLKKIYLGAVDDVGVPV